MIATFSVVWIHSADCSPFLSKLDSFNAYAVPCFILMSIFLATASLLNVEANGSEYLLRRVKRLIVPLFIWTAVYYVARWAKNGGASFEELRIGIGPILMGDASYQLWFLPALFLYQLVTLVVVRNLPSLRSRTHLLILALLFLSMLLPLLRLSGHGYGHFYANLINNLQFVFLGMYVLFLLRDSILNGRLIKWGAFILILLSVLFCSLGFGLNVVVFSLCFFFMSLGFNFPKIALISFAAKNSMGIYLLHGLFVEGGQFFLSRAGVDISGAVPSVLFVVSVFTLSLFISELLGRVKLVRSWHVLG